MTAKGGFAAKDLESPPAAYVGAVNAIGANDNDETDANTSGTSIDGNKYTDYLSQYISSVHNESSEEGNLAYYLEVIMKVYEYLQE